MDTEAALDGVEDVFGDDGGDAVREAVRLGVDGVRRAVHDEPGLTTEMMIEIDEVDVASAVDRRPDVVDAVQELLWAVHSEKARTFDVVSDRVDVTAAVAYDARDSGLSGHVEFDGASGRVEGGPERLREYDLRLTADSDVLAGLLTGSVDPVRAYRDDELEIEGSLSTASDVAEALRTVTRRL
ncbi:MAG: SCP2 sterol-binding domain-containing protein [Halobacteriota archaeon]